MVGWLAVGPCQLGRLASLSHAVAGPAAGGRAEHGGELALGQRLANIQTQAVDGRCGGVHVLDVALGRAEPDAVSLERGDGFEPKLGFCLVRWQPALSAAGSRTSNPPAYRTTMEEAYTSPSIVNGSSRAVTPLSPCARTTS